MPPPEELALPPGGLTGPANRPQARTAGRPLVAIRRLLASVLPYRRYFLAAFAGMGLVAATEPALVWTTKYLVDHGFAGRLARYELVWVPLGLVGVFAVRGLGGFATGYLMIWVSSHVVTRMQGEVYQAILQAPPQVDSHEMGRAINVVSIEGRTALDLVERVLVKVFRNLFSVVALAVTMLQIHPWLGLALLSFVFPFVWSVRVIGHRFEQAVQAYVDANSQLGDAAEEALTHGELVRQHAAGEFEARRLDAIAARVNSAFRAMSSRAGLMVPASQTVVGAYIAGLYWVRPMLGDTFTDGEFVAMSTALMLMMVPLRDLASANAALLRSVVAAWTMFASVDLPRERSGNLRLGDDGVPGIELRNVTATYPGASRPILRGLSLAVAPGETVALSGHCGSGKSSVLSLIAGLLLPREGSVRVGGICVSELDLPALRARIAYVGQDTQLFDDSIAYNVCYGDGAPDPERMWNALRTAQLDTFVAALPAAERTRVGPDGACLSGGQRQLLAIARAAYRDTPIVLLDEPTSALDGESELAVSRSLAALAHGRTVVMVSHSQAALAVADRVLVLDDGRGKWLERTGRGAADIPAPAGAAGRQCA
ncbi:ATP-binding cassette domain-containing protein [Burkholderia sp. LMU1-1-1.1]